MIAQCQYQVDSVHQVILLVGQSTRHECVTVKLTSCRNAGAILFVCHLLAVLRERVSEFRYDSIWLWTPSHRISRDRPERAFYMIPFVSRFRCGCHGLHVDTGRLLPLAQQVPREQRHCVFCASGSAEDEHHFVFDCPAYCAIRNTFTNIFWGPNPTLSSFFTLHDPKIIARFLRECFEYRNTLLAAQTGHNL